MSADDLLKKRLDFLENLKQLKKSPVEMKSDLSQKVAKDLPVDKIDKLQLQKVDSPNAMADTFNKIAHHRAARASAQGRTTSSGIPGEVLDYKKLKQEFKDKAKLEKNSRFAQALKKTGKLGAAIVPGIGVAGALMAGSADEALANTFVPGGIEGLGQGSDMPEYADDTGAVQAAAESAVDPNIRRMALQELKNRSR